MEVSSSRTTAASSTGVEPIKKGVETQEQHVLKVLESLSDESQKAAAQKTGMGTNLNIAG